MIVTADKGGWAARKRDIWRDWLDAQRVAAHNRTRGYRQHTPESIYLCRVGRPIEAVEWSLPMEITYVRGQG